MRRFVRLRDVHCRFPGCRQPARRCEFDHNLDHATGGPTTLCNLACLCKRHHVLKTETPWTAAQQSGGSIVWTSPLGRRTTDPPNVGSPSRPTPILTPTPTRRRSEHVRALRQPSPLPPPSANTLAPPPLRVIG